MPDMITNQRRKMSDETREEIIAELRAYKNFNIDWQQDIEKSKVVASYNNRLASMMAAPGICAGRGHESREILYMIYLP